MEQMHAVEQINPEITEALRSMHKDEKNHIEDIMDMLMKSDPYTLWPE